MSNANTTPKTGDIVKGWEVAGTMTEIHIGRGYTAIYILVSRFDGHVNDTRMFSYNATTGKVGPFVQAHGCYTQWDESDVNVTFNFKN